MSEYTQEQLDSALAEALATERAKFEKLQSDLDSKVTNGIKKGVQTELEKERARWEEQSKLSAEELARKQIEEKSGELSAREKEIMRKANLLDAKELLSDAGVPKSQYEKMLEVLVSDDIGVTQSRVTNFIELHNGLKQEVETKVRTELSKIAPPNSATDNRGEMTKDRLNKMTYGELAKFKAEQPELYKEFMK